MFAANRVGQNCQRRSLIISTCSEKMAREIRSPTINDATQIWRLVSDSGVLDPNSAYLYLLLCRDFSDTCLVAYQGDVLVGFVTGYRLPRDSSVLFVWQVGVAQNAQRQGIASCLLNELVERSDPATLSAIQATISPSNNASRSLFESLARERDIPFIDLPNEGFRESDFPPGDHEDEPRIQIGPFA